LLGDDVAALARANATLQSAMAAETDARDRLSAITERRQAVGVE
jgi:hypothetical protein